MLQLITIIFGTINGIILRLKRDAGDCTAAAALKTVLLQDQCQDAFICCIGLQMVDKLHYHQSLIPIPTVGASGCPVQSVDMILAGCSGS